MSRSARCRRWLPGRRNRAPRDGRLTERCSSIAIGRMNPNLTDRTPDLRHPSGMRHEASATKRTSCRTSRKAGKPLLVRYDLDGVGGADQGRAGASARTDLWRWRELLPVRKAAASSAWARADAARRAAAARAARGGESSSRTRAACRPARSRRAAWRWRCRWRRRSASAHGDADQRQRGRRDGGLCEPRGIRTTIFCPRTRPRSTLARSRSRARTSTASTA